jgi:hypothetical protein
MKIIDTYVLSRRKYANALLGADVPARTLKFDPHFRAIFSIYSAMLVPGLYE